MFASSLLPFQPYRELFPKSFVPVPAITIKLTDSFLSVLKLSFSEHAQLVAESQPAGQPELVASNDQRTGTSGNGSSTSYQMLTDIMFSKEEDESSLSGLSSDGGECDILKLVVGTEEKPYTK